ncbi:uncharacterized protein LOC101452704 isoform X2 [Ceratitis capitata]|uniref:uncharacterized protein LOC101452704 isoform X2 n=1 Tax=Ceratitis capitata TaxID=7213 RepID=UPI00032978CA|nr:uncharacterized protein LOC101452704 isoform X2 [Ceratitis capitata]
METAIKTKKCSVKLNRMSFVGITPAEEQILDQRIRRCAVRLQRCSDVIIRAKGIAEGSIMKDIKMRRCCIRLPRLNLARSEISSRAGSVTSARILSEPELDNTEISNH